MNLNNQSDRNKVLKEYIIYINNVKNYSQNTIKSYSSDIKHYFENTESIGEFSSYLKHLNKNRYLINENELIKFTFLISEIVSSKSFSLSPG